jgi:thiosulfate/3-mercaptopyruvate sulfurtransferase
VKTPILLSANRLERLAADGGCVIVDCRFDLADTAAGGKAFLEGHIPGACYAHLDDDLSSPILTTTGRHPLPSTQDFARYLARIGWTEGRLLVAYDDCPGAIAARLWWLMRFHGQAAALLDGGIAAWKAAGLPLEAGECRAGPTPVPDLVADASQIVVTDELAARLREHMVVDARASERFTGAVEPLDTRAGHIPGALNRPFGSNLKLNGRFRDPAELAAEFESLLGGASPERVVHSCGSGVTACHNLFAMELAGIGGSRLYPGSWSEWIRDPSRPIETGP